MKDKITSFFLSAGSGTTTYFVTHGQEILLAVVMAFIFGVVGLFGNEFGKWVIKMIKRRNSVEKPK